MAELSHVAKAVLDAVKEICPASAGEIAAAALRAAAHEVAPFPGRYPMNEYMEGFRDAKQSVHHQLTAIATELNSLGK